MKNILVGKHDFSDLMEKHDLKVLERKCDFVDLPEKLQFNWFWQENMFLVLASKRVLGFLDFNHTMWFAVLVKIMILRYIYLIIYNVHNWNCAHVHL